jgi:RimJ/RimL family protein N-acetyltransferase
MSLLIRAIAPDEISAFSRFAACVDRGFAPTTPAEFEPWLLALWANSRSSPDLCWIAECDSQIIGAVVYWRQGSKHHIEHCHPPEDGDTARALLLHSMQAIHQSGATSITAEVASPPMVESAVAVFTDRLRGLDFHLNRQRLRFRRSIVGIEAGVDTATLVLRSWAEVGSEAFLAAWVAVSAHSLDHELALLQDEAALVAHAAKDLATAQGEDNRTQHWAVAYLPDGTLVGLVAPGFLGDEAVIHFYGVVPAFRGKGHGRSLLNHGLCALAAAGVGSVRLDVDAGNVPSVGAIRRCGFQQVRSYAWWERSMPTVV